MGSRRTASTVGNMEQTLVRCVALDNHQLSQSALHSKMPMQAMKDWYAFHPDLFHKRPYDRPGCEICLPPGSFDFQAFWTTTINPVALGA
jgi:hypothetical protein